MGLVKVESRSIIYKIGETINRDNEPTFLDIGSSKLKSEALMCCLAHHIRSLSIPTTDNNYDVFDGAVHYDNYVRNAVDSGIDVIDTTLLVYVDDEPVSEESLVDMMKHIKPMEEIMKHEHEEVEV